MRKLLLSILLFTIVSNLFSKDIVITNPHYEFTKTGITHITQIELKANETRVHVHTTFIPNWWVKFSERDFIKDCDTGERYYATGIEKGEFDKELYMPASGDSTFILIFPKLDKSVKKIDFGIDNEDIILGINLNKKKKTEIKENTIPQEVMEWINKEISQKSINKNLTSGDFFTTDSTRIIGYIKGYDARAGFSTGVIYTSNELTREDFPTVINIHPDGRFEATILMNHPKEEFMIINEKGFSIFVKPGETLAIILDWNDFLIADRYRNQSAKFENTIYMGPSAQFNKELRLEKAKSVQFPYREIQAKLQSEISPDEFKSFMETVFSDHKNKLDKFITNENISEEVSKFMKNNYLLRYATSLFDYQMYNSRRTHDGNEPFEIRADYYSFLKDFPMHDPSLLMSQNFSTFINRFEYCDAFTKSYHIMDTFEPENNNFLEKLIKRITFQDSIYTHELELPQSILYDITKTRALNYYFKDMLSKIEAGNYIDHLNKEISHPFLLQEAERIYLLSYSDDSAYELPAGKATEIFKKIIEPFEGKYILVDFWATTCGPCIQSIQNMKEIRRTLNNSNDIAFIFVTSEKESPINRYNTFVEEQELKNTFRLNSDDYLYLRQLFKFNGIPRYVMVDRQGRILNDNFPIYRFEHELTNILEKENTASNLN